MKDLVSPLVATVLTKTCSNLLRMFVLIISWSSSNMAGVGSKSRSLGQILVNLVSTLAATNLTLSFSILLRMFVMMISGSNSNMGGVGWGQKVGH